MTVLGRDAIGNTQKHLFPKPLALEKSKNDDFLKQIFN